MLKSQVRNLGEESINLGERCEWSAKAFNEILKDEKGVRHAKGSGIVPGEGISIQAW